MKYSFLTFAMLMLWASLTAQQTNIPIASKAQDLLRNSAVRNELSNSSDVLGIPFRSIGPSIMSGRVVDIKVNPDNTGDFFVAYASGGLWRTENMGTSFTPLFDHEQVITIGAFDVNWKTGEIWIGTGEVNSSRSSYAGMGVYHSKDWGKTWQHKGLENTHHIGKVIIDPENPEKVWIASLGHLYSPGGGGLFT
ncbi:MAG: WD40/YVTN/BNR-like repeat-containing protein, partial [Flavobacteriales bacterium]